MPAEKQSKFNVGDKVQFNQKYSSDRTVFEITDVKQKSFGYLYCLSGEEGHVQLNAIQEYMLEAK